MALTCNGFLDCILCPEVSQTARSQTSQAYTINWANTWKTENFWKNSWGTKQNGAPMYSWYSGVELSIPRFDRLILEVQLNSLTEIRHQSWKWAAGQGHIWGRSGQLHETQERSQSTWHFLLCILPSSLSGGSSLKCHHPVPGEVTEKQLAQQQEQTKLLTAQSSVSATMPSFFWCLLPSPPAPAASPQLVLDEARRASKYLLRHCIMGLALQLLMAKSASSLPAQTLNYCHLPTIFPELSARIRPAVKLQSFLVFFFFY